VAFLIVLRHLPDDEVGVGEQVARDCGVELRYAGPLDDPPAPVDQLDGLVILGGDMKVDEVDAHPFLATERDLVRAAVHRDVPVLGICLGSQMLARALGAPVSRAPVRELGFVPLDRTHDLDCDPLFRDYRSGERMFQWHEDTFEVPAGAVLLLTGRAVHPQAFRYGDRAWGMQFHGEVDADKLERWLTVAAGAVRAWGGDPDAIRDQAVVHLPCQVDRFRALFAAFVRLVASG
jgi:GMP synthase (glutamine-hydrolysing)